jgi:hypothetical protein
MREQCAAQISSLADEHGPDFALAVERDESQRLEKRAHLFGE